MEGALPWACPEIVEPADAWPLYADQGAFADSVADAIQAAMEEWSDPACATTDCSTVDVDCTEVSCVTEARATWYSRVASTVDTGQYYVPIGTTREWVVSPPPGEAGWTWASLTRSSSRTRAYDGYSAEDTSSGQWSGSLHSDFPADGSFAADHEEWHTDATWEDWRWSSPDCAWTASADRGGQAAVWAEGHHVAVDLGECAAAPDLAVATLDDQPAGLVTGEGWERVADDCADLGDAGEGDTGDQDTAATPPTPATGGCGCAAGGSTGRAWLFGVVAGVLGLRRVGRGQRPSPAIALADHAP